MTKLCIALDTDINRAMEFLYLFRGYSLIFKVSYKLFIAYHRRITDKVKEMGYELFLDLKLHDIPNTVREGIISAKELGADYLTVHLLSGRKAIRQAIEVKGDLKILGVTVLTSMTQEDLREVGIETDMNGEVLRLARIGIDEGVDGLVCSGEEVRLLKKTFGDSFIAVVPGVRFEDEESQDQARVITPKEAIKEGADIIVMGRSILNAKDPIKKVEEILSYN